MQSLSTSLLARDDGGRKGRDVYQQWPTEVSLVLRVVGSYGWAGTMPSGGRDIDVFQSGWLLEPIASGRLTLSTPLQPEGCPLGWEWFSVLSGLGAGRRRGIEYFLRLNLRQ
jgi:hypothetical protein